MDATIESCYPSEVHQWQVSVDTGKTWVDIPGATGLSWSRPVTGAGLYLYRLAVAQAGNLGSPTCEVVSDPVSITVVPKAEPAVTIGADSPVICLGLPTHFLATPVEGGPTPHYQWMVNGGPAGQDSSGFTAASLTGGDAVSCMMTSSAACVLAPVYSNVVRLPAVAVPVQGVSVDPSTAAICADSLLRFEAVADNGGAAPAFRRTVNGVSAGSGPVFTDAGLRDGDRVRCIMTGSLTCSQPVSTDVVVTVYPLPVIRLDPAVVIAGGTGVRLAPVVTGDVVNWSWSPEAGLNDTAVAQPWASPESTTTYTLLAVTAEGCRSTASEVVEVYYPLQMPGAFTPNGDGRNDVFRVPAVYPVRLRYLAVFNREGLRVFYTTDVAAGWDGRYNGVAQPAGAYVWVVVFENPVSGKVEMRKGTVVLVR
jgi:gliding motility-associated-like protein